MLAYCPSASTIDLPAAPPEYYCWPVDEMAVADGVPAEVSVAGSELPAPLPAPHVPGLNVLWRRESARNPQ
jgi:hypothetical protein